MIGAFTIVRATLLIRKFDYPSQYEARCLFPVSRISVPLSAFRWQTSRQDGEFPRESLSKSRLFYRILHDMRQVFEQGDKFVDSEFVSGIF